MKLTGKHIVILEGADCSGKSSLLHYLQDNVEGKCHSMHSNYSKLCSKQAHRHQHFMMCRFASKQFKKENYTGNNLVIMDRNYISDIIYGMIGYGSEGDFSYKMKTLKKLFRILRRGNPDVKISLVFCRPKKIDIYANEEEFSFDREKKEELLDDDENLRIRRIYDWFFRYPDVIALCKKYGIKIYTYNYHTDSDYTDIINKLNFRPYSKVNGEIKYAKNN